MSTPTLPDTILGCHPDPPTPPPKDEVVFELLKWYFRVFLNHFLIYFPLPLTVGFLLALMANVVLVEHGVLNLILHDSPWLQFCVGASLYIVFAQVLFVGHLLWLHDRREKSPDATAEEMSYGVYAWGIVVCVVVSVGVVKGGAELVKLAIPQASAPAQSGSPIAAPPGPSAEGIPQPRGEAPQLTPWLPLLLALVLGLVFWSVCRRANRRRAQAGKKDAWVPTVVWSLAFLTVCLGVFLLYDWLGDRSRKVTDFSPLILGGATAGVFLCLLQALADNLHLGEGWVVNRRGERKDLVRAVLTRPPLPLRLGATAAVCALWVFLLWKSLDGNWVGWAAAGAGLLVTLIVLAWPRKEVVSLYLLANGIAFIVSATWVLNELLKAGLHRAPLLLFYTFLPFLGLLWLALLIAYVPDATEKLFFDNAPAPDGSKPGAAELTGRSRAVWALVGGWFFFTLVCSTDAMASPVSMVCALLFFLVAIYGFVAYYLRGITTAIIASLVLLAILSGAHPYKFRFPAPLADIYEGTTPYRNLETALQEDRERIAKHGHCIDRYTSARDCRDAQTGRVQILQSAKLAPIPKEIAGEEGEYAKALRAALDQAKRAEATFHDEVVRWEEKALSAHEELRKNRILEGGSLEPRLLPAKNLKAGPLLPLDRVDWGRYGRLGGAPMPAVGKKPLILVTVSGGAQRSAAWSLLVLQELERAFAKKDLDFPAHVRLITGASGGMLGAAYYVASLEPPTGDNRILWEAREKGLERQFDELATSDNITPLMRQFVFGDVPNFFSPWAASHDRGKALEDAWQVNLKRWAGGERVGSESALDVTFPSLLEGEQQGWCPSLVFTPMMIEDGRRLIISNMNLFPPTSNGGNLLEPLREEDRLAALIVRLDSKGDPSEQNASNAAKSIINGVIDSAKKEARETLKAELPVGGAVPNEDEVTLRATVRAFGHIDTQIRAFDHRLKLGVKSNDAAFRAALADLNAPIPDDLPLQPGNYSIEALELFRLFPDAWLKKEQRERKEGKPDLSKGFRLSTAVRMSASFPFFSPAVSLPTEPRRRVVDAGYYDNYGVSFSSAWLNSMSNRDWLEKNVSRVCLVQIRDGVQDEARRLNGKIKDSNSTEFTRSVEEIFSPLEGLYNAQFGSSSFRNDGQLELLTRFMQERGIPFQVVNFELNEQVSLNWWLASGEQEKLKGATKQREFRSRVNSLLDFLYPTRRPALDAATPGPEFDETAAAAWFGARMVHDRSAGGLRVTAVVPNGLAEQLGLARDDVIKDVNDTRLERATDLWRAVKDQPVVTVNRVKAGPIRSLWYWPPNPAAEPATRGKGTALPGRNSAGPVILSPLPRTE